MADKTWTGWTPEILERWRRSERAKELHRQGKFRRKSSPKGQSPRQKSANEIARERLERIIRDPKSSNRIVIDATKELRALEEEEERRSEPPVSLEERVLLELEHLTRQERDVIVGRWQDHVRPDQTWKGAKLQEPFNAEHVRNLIRVAEELAWWLPTATSPRRAAAKAASQKL